MKIALLNLGRINNAFGGTEKVFFDMANNLSRLGHDVSTIVHDTHSGAPGFPIDEKVRYYNCRVSLLTNINSQILRRLVPLFYPRSQKLEIKFNYKYRPRVENIKAAIEKEKPDVIVTFHPFSTFFAKEFVKTDIPIVSMFHLNPGNFDSHEDQMYYESLKKCHAVQVLMPEYIPPLLKALAPYKQVISVPNIVPQYTQQSTCTNPVIVNVARLCPNNKRQHLIIEAFNLLKNDFPQWRVELWGDSGERPKYAHKLALLIKKYHLEDRVKLCGPTKDVPSKLQNASVFCFPSAIEGMPLAMTEAMSIGLPIIGCKKCSAVNSIIHHGKNGFLCDDTPEDIAAHLRILMSDTELRQKMGQQAREDMKQYAPEVIWKRWDELLKKIHAGEPIVE